MEQECQVCGNVGFTDGGDGFFYCGTCDSQVEGMINAVIDEADICDGQGRYSQRHSRATPRPSRPSNDVKPTDKLGPTGPTDFGSCQVKGNEDDSLEIRWRYVMGFQIMLQLQSKAMVEYCNVSKDIVHLHNPIWLRLLACTRVMAHDWADNILNESEIQYQGDVTESQRSARHASEQHNMFGQRLVMIWFRSLRSCLPISYTLALSFLFCHVAEEPILPTDILKGVLEGKIPYYSAFDDIEKQLRSTPSCPISCSVMFRPTQVPSLQKLEATAASIAEKIGLKLRPLNYNSLATRYIEDLSLSVPKILPLASRIYEWSMPEGIYLSSNELKLPSRVRLMSILVVAVRIYYNINGFGKWESIISNSTNSLPADKLSGKEKRTSEFDDIGPDAPEERFVPDISSMSYEVHEADGVELFHTLDGKFNNLCELHDTFEHYKDLPSYLQFCKDSVFAGGEQSLENSVEEKMTEVLWKFYLDEKDSEPSQNEIIRPGDDDVCTPTDSKSLQGDGDKTQFSQDNSNFWEREDIVKETPLEASSDQYRTILSLKRDMEENKFVYIPPRSNVKKKDHIYYSRKKRNGAFVYAVHGDYYILLRSCAKVCQVDMRTMHMGVLTFERELRKRETEQVASEV